MERKFTEKDAVLEAEAIHAKLIGSEFNSDDVIPVLCPLLTAGRMSNPDWERGGVSCLEDNCALYDIDEGDPASRNCQLYNAGHNSALLYEALEDIYKLLHKRL